jgi:trk system potassium uptake protein TrkA
MTQKRFIVIAGCGRLGSLLADELSQAGHSVVVIDLDEAKFANLSGGFGGFRVAGDALESAVLRRAQIERADCLLATTAEDNTNLMLVQVASAIFKVPVVIARLFNPLYETIYQEMGIDTVSPTGLAAVAFEHIIAERSQEHQMKSPPRMI